MTATGAGDCPARERSWLSRRRPNCPAPCDFLVRELLIDAKRQRRALLRWQFRNRGAHFGRALAAHHLVEGVGHTPVGSRRRVDRLGLDPLRRDPVQADVHADAIEPRAERRFVLEVAQGLERPHEHILGQIRCIFVVVHEAITELVDVAPVALDDRVERLAVSLQERRHQRFVVGVPPINRRRTRLDLRPRHADVPSRRALPVGGDGNIESDPHAVCSSPLSRLDRPGDT